MPRRWPSKLCSPQRSLCLEATYLSIFGTCCYLALGGWLAASAGCFFLAATAYMIKAVTFAVVSHRERGTSIMPFLFFTGRTAVIVLSILTFNASTQGYRYLMIADPSTSVHGVGLRELIKQLAARPRAYDVILTDGFVQTNWTGLEQETHCGKDACNTISVAAAPIFESASAAHGPPLAWAVGRTTIRPVYCGRWKGLCGIYEGMLTQSAGVEVLGVSVGGRDMVRLAAQKAAAEGGFPFVTGLPMLRLSDPAALMEVSGKWMRHLWSWFLVSLVLAVFANADTIGALVEKDEAAELRALL